MILCDKTLRWRKPEEIPAIQCDAATLRIPFYRCGKRIVLDRADLEAFLHANRVEACQPGSAA
jgi:hypothetical protein